MSKDRFWGNQFKRTSVIDRFWYYADKKEDNDCWEWVGTIFTKTKYGSFWVNGKTLAAHRFSWELHYGEIPKGKYICHHCDNRSCVNPTHLFMGTQLDNMRDKVAKDRQAKGSKNGQSKLSEEEVLRILALYELGHTKISIVEEFDVSYDLIKKITRRELWTYLDE